MTQSQITKQNLYLNLYQLKNFLEDKFILEFTSTNKTNKTNKIKKKIELTIGDIACFVNLIQILFVILLLEVYYQNVTMVMNLLLYMYWLQITNLTFTILQK